jgi:hypothetical protein
MERILRSVATRNATAIAAQGPENGPGVNKLSHLIDSPSLHVILVGTGSPIATAGRVGSSTALVGNGHFVLIDAGK